MSTTSEPHADPRAPGNGGAQLDRSLGVGSIVFMVVAGAAPLATCSASIPFVFGLSGSAASSLYFVGAGIVLGLFSIGFVLMSRQVPNAGAFYAYIQAGLGKVTGAGAASLAIVAYTLLLCGGAAYLGSIVSSAADEFFDLKIKWWICALVVVVAVGLLAYRDIAVSAKFLAVVLVAEVIVVLVIDLAIVFQGGKTGLSARPLNVGEVFHGAPGLGLVFAFLCFFGFEATAVFRGEAKDPDRTIPRATYIAVTAIALFYCFTAWCMAVGVGPASIVKAATSDPSGMFRGLAVEYVGSALKDIITVMLITSFFAALLTFQNVVARYQFNLANGGLLPSVLGEVHPKYRAPSKSSLVVSVMAFLVVAGLAVGQVDPVLQIFPWFTGVASLAILILMFLTSLAVIVFHQRNPAAEPVWNSLIAPALAVVGLGVTLYLAIANFALLAGTQKAANIIFVLTALAFAAGAGVVALAKMNRPEVYGQMLENRDSVVGTHP